MKKPRTCEELGVCQEDGRCPGCEFPFAPGVIDGPTMRRHRRWMLLAVLAVVSALSLWGGVLVWAVLRHWG